jgi:hypothetical protein
MKESEVFDGDQENYIRWMKAVKEYMTVRSIDFNNDTTQIHWLGLLLKGDTHQLLRTTGQRLLRRGRQATHEEHRVGAFRA